MRNITKRSLSLLVVIALCLSFIVPSVQLPAAAETTVDYKTSGDYVYNWGIRDELATFMSPNAEAFYQENGVILSELMEMSGSATVNSVPYTDLYKELQELMESNHTTKTSYDGTRNLYQYTDSQNNGSPNDKISTFYMGKLVGPAWDSGSTWNREHTWPNSKGLNGQDENDIMMLRPADSSTNSSRGNKAYGEGASYYDPNSLGQNVRGDVARIMLYQYVRWGNTDYMWGTEGVMESKDILLKWMEEDPVDTWELGRNDSVESITGTRNVFVDYPELAFQLFSEEVPANYETPSNGSDVALDTVTVQFSENGSVVAMISEIADNEITLPEHMGAVPAGYTFVGWVETTVEDTTDKPATVHAAGSQYPAEDIVLHALYSITEEGEGGGSGEAGWLLTDLAAIQDTDVVVITMTKDGTTWALPSSNGSSSAPTATVVTVSDSKLAAEPTDALKWNIVKSGNNLTIYPNGVTNKWLYSTTSNNGIRVGTGANKTFIVEGTYGYLQQTNTSRYMGVYNNQDWRSYTSMHNNISGQTLGFYVLTAGGTSATTTYSTSATPCAHTNGQSVAAVPADCETEGNTAGMYCPDCKIYYGGYAVIEPTGHAWVAGTAVPPTATEQGYTPYTCSNGCGQTKQDNFVPALGVEYTLTFKVPAGVTAIADATVDEEGIALPTPTGTPTGNYTYEFIGWSATNVENTTEAPQLVDDYYLPTANTTLYAVYTYTVGGSGSSDFKLVTDASQLIAGNEIVLVGEDTNGAHALSTNQKSSNRGATAVTVNGDTVTWTAEDVQIITLEEGTVSGTFAFYVEGDSTGYLYAASSSSNNLKTGNKNDNASWLITIADGKATIVAQGTYTRNNLKYNYNNGTPLFACYASTNTQQTLASIYTKGASGTTYYSSLTCTHANTENRAEVPAECEEPGIEAGVFCTDCQTYISGGAVIPALGHDMVAGTPVPPTATEQGYTTYTCANGCGKTEDRDFVEATGEEFTVTFAVPAGVAAVEAMTINSKTGDTLPTAGVPTGDVTYTFAGWATAAVAEDTEDAPTLYNGNYKPTANITLYAVYSYTEGGSGSGASVYEKVTTAPADWSGEYLIVYEDGSVAFNGGLDTLDGVSNTIPVTIIDGSIIEKNDTTGAAQFTIAAMTDGYSVQSASGKYIGRSANSNELDEKADPQLNTIEIHTDGSIKITGTGGPSLRYNDTSNQLRFRYYKNDTAGQLTQKPIALYKASAGGSSTTYYTSAGAVEPAPSIDLTSVAASFDSAMTFNFVATKASLDQFEDVYVEFTADGKETERVEGQLFTREGVQYYAFGFTQLNIRDLGLEVYATIHGTYNGQPVSGATKSYSLLKYCTYAINGNSDDALPCAYLLKYAQAAEEFKNVAANERLDVTALESKMATIFAANSDIEAAEPARNTAHTPGTQIAFAGQNVDMATRISMIYYLDLRSYTGDQEKVTVTVDYTDGVTGQPAQKTYQFRQLVANSAEGFYEVHFGEHLLTQMNDEITCTVYIDGVFETSYQNSIEHYCYTTVNNANSSAAEIELAKSIYRYGVACAETY